MPLRYLLHIGRHKSGTSSLQFWLHQHRHALKEQGVLYPETGLRGSAHHKLGQSLQGHPEPQVIDKFRQELTEETQAWQGLVLLSSEAFQGVHPDVAAQVFPPDQTRVICYLREQCSYLESAYQQYVQRRDFDGSLADFLESRSEDYGRYQRFLDQWATTFGTEHLLVARYDRSLLFAGDIIQDFCHRTGIPLVAETVSEDINPSIGGGLLEIKRIANALAWDLCTSVDIFALCRAVALSDVRWRRRPQLERPLARKLRDAVASENQAVAARYLSEDGTLFRYHSAWDEPPLPLPASELCGAMAALSALNPEFGRELSRRIIEAAAPSARRAATYSWCQSLRSRWFNSRVGKSARNRANEINVAPYSLATRDSPNKCQSPAELLDALSRLRHPKTGEPWSWNFPISWQA